MIWVRKTPRVSALALRADVKTLTGIRGLAALWVVSYHMRTNPYPLSFFSPGAFTHHGVWTVDIFFVLSGFVLTHVYERTFENAVGFKSYSHFLGLRLARMYPLHIVCMICAFCLFMLSYTLGSRTVAPYLWDPYDAFLNLFLLHAWGFADHLSFNTVSWSISAEWFAYVFLLVPCIRLLHNVTLAKLYMLVAILWSILILVIVPSTPFRGLDITFDFGIVRIIPEFIGGYVAYRTVKTMHGSVRFFDLLFAAGFTGIVFLTHYPQFQILLLPLTMLLIIGLSAEGQFGSLVFGNRISVFLGEVSYSIYMSHFMLRWVVDGLAKRAGLPITPWTGVGFVAVYLTFLILVSYLLNTLVEEPSRKWARKKLGSTRVKMPETKDVAANPRKLREIPGQTTDYLDFGHE